MKKIKEISEQFTVIDSLIVEILNCAAEDFLGLNERFKEAYAKSTSISANAEEVFAVYASSYTSESLLNLKLLFKKFSQAKKETNKYADSIVKSIDEVYDILDSIDLHSKNINQNLLTLKFLLANLKITGIESNSVGTTKEKDELFIEFNRLVNKSKLAELELAKSLHGNMKFLREGVDRVKKNMRNANQPIGIAIEIINESILVFSEKQQDLSLNLPKLQEHNAKLRDSIDSIITNLQYHDIIRQKIEHVQVSHKEILNNLSSEDESEQKNYLNQIAELVNIQSALLVRANKEYQRAIEQIIDKFKIIGSIAQNILNQCRDLKRIQESDTEQPFTNVAHKLTNTTLPVSKYLSLLARVNNLLQSIRHNVSLMVEASAIDDDANRFGELLLKRIKQPELMLQSNLIQQIETVTFDIITSRSQIGTLYMHLESKISDIERLSELISENTKSQEWESIPTTLKEIASNLLECDEKVSILLKEKFQASNDLGDIIHRAVSQVKYYEVFELKILDVIKLLNQIYSTLTGKEESQFDRDDLEFMRKLYTMESEHRIHNMVIKGNAGINDLSETDQDESNIEFF
ncbi:MAG TPA: hypothetical protein ENN49_10520 [Bacteroidales bacterium]|nr:hypothetical protein [Bacteroidales bacterium]